MPELQLGCRSRSLERTIERSEIELLSTLTVPDGADALPRTTGPLGGALLAAVVATLAANTAPLYRELRETHGMRIIAALGMSATFHASVGAGDTVWAETWLQQVRVSASNPARRIATCRDEGRNQNGALVVELVRTLLVQFDRDSGR